MTETKPTKSKNRRGPNKRRRGPRNNNAYVNNFLKKAIEHQNADPGGTRETLKIEDIVVAMERTPRTRAGASFIKKALNPCGEDPVPGYIGIPDSSGNDSVALEFRDDILLRPQPDPLDPEATLSFVVFCTPYFMVHYIALRFYGSGPSDANLRDCLNAITITQQDTLGRYPNWYTPVNVINAAGTGLTPYTGPPFDITFIVPAALSSFTANATLGQQSPSWTWFRKWRYSYKGATMHLNAPGLANQGRVLSAATATESSIKNLTVSGTGTTPISARFSVSPPFQDTFLAQQDANAHQDLAKKGEYVVMRHANANIILNEAEDVRAIWRVESAATQGAGGTGFIIPSAQYTKVDGFDMNMGWIVQNIRGVSQSSSIHLKLRSGICATVPGTSPWAVFLKSSVTEDAPAMVLYKELCARLPHSFVSDYNDWGLLSKIINTAMKQIGIPLLRKGVRKGAGLANALLDSFEGPAEQMPFNSSRGGYGNRTFTGA